MVHTVIPLFTLDGEAPGSTRIYFGLEFAEERVKIGMTRRKISRRGGEMHFSELCSVPGERVVEDQYHAKYAVERIGRTEWFVLSNRLLLDLMVMCQDQGRARSYEILRRILLRRLRQQRNDAA